MVLMTALTRHQSAAALILLSGPLASLSVCGQMPNPPAILGRAQPRDSAQIPLIRANSEEFPGDAAAKVFFVQLPEHVSFQAGCELRLALYPSREVLSRLCTITASVNGKPLSRATVEGKGLNHSNDLAIRVRFPVPEDILVHGWERISIRFVLRRPPPDSDQAKEPGTWAIRRSDSHL